MGKVTQLFFAVILAVLMLCLAGCSAQDTTPPNETVYRYSLSASTAQELAVLNEYPNLTEVDLRGSSCYADILAYIQSHPSVAVVYDVQLGQTRYEHTTTELTLEDGAVSYEELKTNLVFLPDLQRIQLPKTTLTIEQITELQQLVPNVKLSYTVVILDKEFPHDTTELDLSSISAAQIEQIAPGLRMLPDLETIWLMTADGSSALTPVDVKKIMDAVPGVVMEYEFDLFGKRVSTTDETVEFVQQYIGNEGEEEIRQALDIMPACTYFKADRCGIDTEVMASLREDYPNTKIVWRIFFGKFNCLVDEEMLRLTNGLTDDIVDDLKYCNDVKYLDIGHDDELTDISFIRYMPKLEIAILSGSIVSDLTPFQDHQNIEFLELCFCSQIKDISPLANCPNLKFLNISFTGVKDISATDNLPMERFVAMGLKLDYASQSKFLELHPESLYRFEGQQCYGYAWRYDDYGYTFSDYYANMRVIFNYEDVGYYSGRGIYNTY